MDEPRALAFEGGGFNGAAEVKRWGELHRSGYRYNRASGESVGSLSAFASMITDPDGAMEIWSRIRPESVFRKGGGGPLNLALAAAGLRAGAYDMTPLLKTLEGLTARYRVRPGCEVVVTRTNLRTGARIDSVIARDAPSPAAAARLLWQSCLVPLAHQTDGVWADGGVSASAPLGPVVSRGSNVVDVILLNTIGTRRWMPSAKAIDKALRSIEILRENLFFSDIQGTVLRNDLARARPDGRYREVDATFHVNVSNLPDWMDGSPEAFRARQGALFHPFRMGPFFEALEQAREEAEWDSANDTLSGKSSEDGC